MKKTSINFLYEQQINRVELWAHKKILNLFIFNAFLAFALLLHSAGYFSPYLPITINLVVLFSLVLIIMLLNAKSNIVFCIALFFWLLAAFLKIVLVDAWAERTAIYCFESLFVGIILLVYEHIKYGRYNQFKYEED